MGEKKKRDRKGRREKENNERGRKKIRMEQETNIPGMSIMFPKMCQELRIGYVINAHYTLKKKHFLLSPHYRESNCVSDKEDNFVDAKVMFVQGLIMTRRWCMNKLFPDEARGHSAMMVSW